MPPNYVILSVEAQEGFAQELKNNTRQFQVTTETQAKIVRQLTAELWMYNRLGSMLCTLDERNYDKAHRDYPDYSAFVKASAAAHNGAETDKLYRQIERRRAGHLKAWGTFCRMITHLQKHHSDAIRDPEVRNLVQAEAQLEAEAELWNEPIEPPSQPNHKRRLRRSRLFSTGRVPNPSRRPNCLRVSSPRPRSTGASSPG